MIITTLLAGQAAKAAVSITGKYALQAGEKILGMDRTVFEKELENVIYTTIDSYASTFPVQEEPGRIPFYQSDVLLQTLLSIKFMGRLDSTLSELKSLLSQSTNVIPPTNSQIEKFCSMFEEECKRNPALVQHQFKDNYREAVFEVLEVVSLIQSSLSKVLSEINTSLTNEYFAELDEILNNVYAFKPFTALERIEGLEARIAQNHSISVDLEARLLFLKGTCMLETNNAIRGCELIVQSYIKSGSNLIKNDAAVAYLNLRETTKSASLTEELIAENPYNANAWLLRIYQSGEGFREVWKTVPITVKEKPVVVISLVHYLKYVRHESGEVLEEMGLVMPDTKEQRVTHANFSSREKVVQVMLHEYFSGTSHYSVRGDGKLVVSNHEELRRIFAQLQPLYEAIKGTEVFELHRLTRFYYCYLSHLLGNDAFDSTDFHKDYLELKDSSPSVELHYAQFLADQGQIEKALENLAGSKFNTEEPVILQRIIYSRIAKKDIVALDLLKQHIAIIDDIDYTDIFNLNNLFGLFLPDISALENEFRSILSQKTFKDEATQALFRTTIEINHLSATGENAQRISELLQLAETYGADEHIHFHIASLLFQLGALTQCADMLKPRLLPGVQSNVSQLYCQACFQGNYKLQELLGVLSEIRLNNENNVYSFLAMESDLRRDIDDVESMIEIAWRGVRQYPHVESFHLNLLTSLIRRGLSEQIEEYVKKHLKKDFSDEQIGVSVSTGLSKNGYVKEGVELMYRLACNPANNTARLWYMAPAVYPKDFFIDYGIAEIGSHVKLVDAKKNVKLLTITEEDQYSLIGKGIGDAVLLPAKFGNAMNEFRLARIMDPHLFLFEQILEEAKNPYSELQMETFDFSNDRGEFDRESFERQFVERFGSDAESDRSRRLRVMEEYNDGRLSFTEVCMQAFSNNPVECHMRLTSHRCFALPSMFNAQLPLTGEEEYAIDFTSLVVFTDLQSDLGIEFDKKFLVSTNLYALLKKELDDLKLQKEAPLKLAVINNEVVPILYPENYNEILIDRHERLLAFINRNCVEKVIEEKVNFSEPVTQRVRGNALLETAIDNALFSTNLRHVLISNDTYLLKHFSGLRPQIIAPELFLLRHVKRTLQREIAEYFIRNHYIGVTITKDVIHSEHLKKLSGQPNLFDVCLSNLRYRWSLNPANIIAGVTFIREVYLSSLSSDRERSLVAQTVFENLLDGCSENEYMIYLIRQIIFSQFKLMGTALDKVNDAFAAALSKVS